MEALSSLIHGFGVLADPMNILYMFIGIFLGVLIGILWIIEGAVALAQAGSSESKAWSIFFGILSIIAGIVLLFSPFWGAAVLFWVAGIALIVLGIVQIVRAFTFGRGVTTAA